MTRGYMAEHMDKCLAGRAIGEAVDHVGVVDVGLLIVLLGEELDVLPKGLIGPLHFAQD